MAQHFGRASLGGKLGISRPLTMTFPVLDISEILSTLHEMDIAGVAEDDLVKARPEVVKKIYDHLLVKVLSVTKDSLYAPKYNALHVLEHTELFDEAAHIIFFIRCMHKMLHMSGVQDGFCLRDLTKPDRSRIQKHLSAIINLYKFKESVEEEHQPLVDHTLELKESCAKLDDLCEELQMRLQDARIDHDAAAPALTAAEAAIAALAQESDDLTSRAEKLKAVGNEQREATREMIEQLGALELRVVAIKASTEASRSRIVSSPQRLRDDLDATARLRAVAQQEQKAAEEECRTLEMRQEVIAKAERDVHKAVSLLSEVETEMSRLKNLNKLAKAKAFELTACQGNLAELHAQTRHLDEQLRSKDSKLADMKSEFAARTGSADRGAVALRHELSSLQDSLADCRQRRADAEALKRQLEHARDRALSHHNSEMAEIIAGVRQLTSAVSAYHSRLFHSMTDQQHSSRTLVSSAGILP